jgi:hypothetical protein
MIKNKKLVPVAAIPVIGLILLVAAMMSAGAAPAPTQGVHVPPGALVVSPNAHMANDTPPPPVPAAPALPPATGPVAISEDFSSPDLSAWQTTGDAPTTWVARDGRLQQDLPLEDGPSDQSSLFVTKDSKFTNGTIETEFYATSGSPVGVVLRGSDQGYYRITLNMNVSTNSESKAQIERITPDSDVVIATAPFSAFHGYNLGQWQHLAVSAQGNTITVSVDGNQIMSATDSGGHGSNAYTTGWAGVWTLGDLGATFDNIRIQLNAVR